MRKINEEFLHFLWKNQHLTGIRLTSPGNSCIEVLDPGMHNLDAGPDFFNAKVTIDGTTWAGNVELHINASDWIRHGHSSDKGYDSVILHVVCFNDCEITRTTGETIPSVMLRFPSLMWDTYNELRTGGKWIPCQEQLYKTKPIHVAQWTSSLMVEKLQERSGALQKNMEELHGHWDAILSRILFRSFGLPVNTIPFEMLSLMVPYPLLLRNKENLFALEAILFGQSGMLCTTLPHDKYTEGLKQEFTRFSGKLEETTVPSHIWKYMRMRPSSFPSLRIALLAACINRLYPLHQFLEKYPGIDDLNRHFRVRAGDYWNSHYQLGKESGNSPKYMGRDFIKTIIINCIAPYTFFYGKINSREKFCDYAIHLLEQLPPENNTIVTKWGQYGIKCSNAFESQALLFLYKNYCKNRRCLECQFGNHVILESRINSLHSR